MGCITTCTLLIIASLALANSARVPAEQLRRLDGGRALRFIGGKGKSEVVPVETIKEVEVRGKQGRGRRGI